MAMSDAELADARRRMNALFPTKFSHTMWHLEHFARTLQTFDVTFYRREPILDVQLERDFARELMAALGCWRRHEFVRRVQPLVQRVVFSDGTTTHVDDIWTINYMPDGITIAQLDGADLVMTETKAGYGGETIRQMIRATYHCGSAAEEDWFVRRWIAS